MSTTSGRLLALLSLLQTPRDWPGGELADRLGVSLRTVRRDVDRLRDLGYPVEAKLGSVGGYRLVAGTAMPPLLLDDEEAVAVAVGLRVAAAQSLAGAGDSGIRALAKLEQVLPSRLRRRVKAVGAATASITRWQPPTVDAELLATLALAAAGHDRIRFDYRRPDRPVDKRLVEPDAVVAAGHRWYLVGFDLDRNDRRIFRADRIERLEPTGVRFTRTPVSSDVAADLVAASLARLSPIHSAEVIIHADAVEAARRFGEHPAQLRPLDDGRCLLTGYADALPWLAIRLLSLGLEFRVLGPPELIDYVAELGQRAARSVD
ncbi:putative DNA-binding transcriptional regulator YafY [Stackebrandtia endophytica]|uniref:Putative DNA-binding transcriptional regulator YafY n=1 Tax=Stackebrandtia endophytica TaxID=1496996 RepID=A0A543AVN9_9ACTN|nr:YafY family protein [Stackebrandtia endophytica]TQL76624.1 putative DNA-binding transcriptional regulator YafY [Stackebrandtia endophytica]